MVLLTSFDMFNAEYDLGCEASTYGDVYSFGILIMEVISGRIPVDYSRPPEEVRTNY